MERLWGQGDVIERDEMDRSSEVSLPRVLEKEDG